MKLNEAVDLMERHVNEQTKQHEKVLAAELKSRFVLLYLAVLSRCCFGSMNDILPVGSHAILKSVYLVIKDEYLRHPA